MRIVWSGLAVLNLAACATAPTPDPILLTPCPAVRPQVCTMEYAPVCADMIAGGQILYSSPCNACADDNVAAYLEGACPG